MFISTGHGFQLLLPNGWKVSVQFGNHHYCENRDRMFKSGSGALSFQHELEVLKKGELWTSGNAEMAILDPQGGFINTWYGGDDVMGWVTVEQFLTILAEVAQYSREQTIEEVEPQFGRSRADVLRDREI
jgi:hypothetical protein